MINLEAPGILKQLSKQIKFEIDRYCVDTYDDGPRSHLGASEIGHNCSRYLWYKFRWIAHKTHDGRQYRLFQRGHFEEPRFIQYLEGIGFQVQQFDPEAIARGETDKGKMQIRIGGCRGHFGGSVDGIAYREDTGNVLTEFKTNGTGKGFTELSLNGCQLKKHQHFCQQSIYGYKLGLKHSLYLVVNKNDDDLHVEVIPLDWKLGAELEKKAEMIIFAEEPPSKLSQSASYYECSWCDVLDVCHNGKCAEKNCRSCKFAFPIDNAEWLCSKWNANIPKEAIKAGCDEWIPIV
jgi:hypothetical protein